MKKWMFLCIGYVGGALGMTPPSELLAQIKRQRDGTVRSPSVPTQYRPVKDDPFLADWRASEHKKKKKK